MSKKDYEAINRNKSEHTGMFVKGNDEIIWDCWVFGLS